MTSHPIGPVRHHFCWSTSNWTKLGEGHGTLVIRHVPRNSLEFVNKHPWTIQPTCGEKRIIYFFFWKKTTLPGILDIHPAVVGSSNSNFVVSPSFLVGTLWLLPRWISGTREIFAWTTEIESIQFIQIDWICLFTLLSCCQSFGPNDRRWILQGRST